MPIKKGDLAKIDYSMSLEDGTIIDASIGFIADSISILDPYREYKPIELIVGQNNTMIGLENALIGMDVNETKTFKTVLDINKTRAIFI